MYSNFDFNLLADRKKFSKIIAQEGIVLLKNEENVLPIKDEKVAVFGSAQLKGKVVSEGTAREAVGITEAISGAGIDFDTELHDIYNNWRNNLSVGRTYGVWRELTHAKPEMEVDIDLVKKVKANGAEKAIIVIGRDSFENSDMEIEKGDYLLSDIEAQMVKNVCSVFSDVILMLNIGCAIDIGFLDECNIKGILYLNKLGDNGTQAMADILKGAVNPSGKLTFSFSKHFEDYSSSDNFGQHGGGLLQDYKEDIYVGYRYFDSFDGADKNLVFPFGFGLSYTDFAVSDITFSDGDEITVTARVENIGKVAGKQVLQLYFEAPTINDGAVLGAPAKQLCAFEKTKLLNPGEAQVLTLNINADDMASYDDLGVLGVKSCYVLEKGSYKIMVGTSSRDLEVAGVHTEKENRIIERCHTIDTTLSERLNRKGGYDILPEPAYGSERYYGVSAMEKTVLLAKNSVEGVSNFADLKAGDTITYNLLPGTGGGYYIELDGIDENTAISDIITVRVDGVETKKSNTNVLEINLPIGKTKVGITFNRDNVSADSLVFEKIDFKTVISPDKVNVINAANMYEGTFSIGLENFEDDGFGNAGTCVTDFDRSGMFALYKLEVEKAGIYDIQFRYAFFGESRPINASFVVFASNIVQPLSGVTIEKTYNEGEKRIFKDSEKCPINLPEGIVYLKVAVEDIPAPDFSTIFLTASNSQVAFDNTDNAEVSEKNATYIGIPKRPKMPDPSTFERKGIQFEEVYKTPELMDAFLKQLTNRELATIVSGTSQDLTETGDVGCNHPLPERGVPAAQTADGPCGLRQRNSTPIAFPASMVLAAAFNKELAFAFGECIAFECIEYNVDYLLGPSINIFRSVAGGRNCSYYSEDPYISGVIAAYCINGTQKHEIAAVLKHYAANNSEFERLKSNSRVSERALREIYMKGFEIAVKLSDPYAIMSSYNNINDIKACENYTLITEIPRDEWNWDGCFFTDWWNDSVHAEELKAGHDLKMSTGDIDGVTKALDEGKLSREQVYPCAARVIRMLMKLRRIKKYLQTL